MHDEVHGQRGLVLAGRSSAGMRVPQHGHTSLPVPHPPTRVKEWGLPPLSSQTLPHAQQRVPMIYKRNRKVLILVERACDQVRKPNCAHERP